MTVNDGTVKFTVKTACAMENVKSIVKSMLLAAFPVGTIIESMNDVNPSTYIGGTWEKLPAGYATISAGVYTENHDGTSQSYTYIAGNTYGEAAHKLAVREMPAHIHYMPIGGYEGWENMKDMQIGQYVLDFRKATLNQTGIAYTGPGTWTPASSTGGNGYHNNIPPSLAAYRFKRIK